MRTIIAGSRDIHDMNELRKALEHVDWEITVVLSGKARGADKLGEDWAKENGITIESYPAKWRPNDRYDPEAGKRRNSRMAVNADSCVILYNGGKSPGSMDMRRKAKAMGLKLVVWNVAEQKVV